MVNHVVGRSELTATVMDIARRIAAQPAFALQMAKKAVNHAVDLGGQAAAIDHAYGLHQLCHAHNMLVYGRGIDPSGLPAAAKPAGAR
jgi:enoyl-CoA hydratase